MPKWEKIDSVARSHSPRRRQVNETNFIARYQIGPSQLFSSLPFYIDPQP